MTFYRKAVWYIRGLRDYTKSGYEKASCNFLPDDLQVDLNGQVFVITGANSGLGLSTTQTIAQKGAEIHMVCRNVEKAEKMREDICKNTGNQKLFVHGLDMANASDVAKFVEKFASDHPKVDCLINNAGCMINERTKTSQNLEANFATNTLATHMITVGLLSALKESSHGRVVTVSSGGMLLAKLDSKDLNFENLQPFDGAMAYSQNKRQQVVLCEQYAKRYSDAPVRFWSCHPGWADTPSVQSSLPDFYAQHKDKLRTVEQGADTVVWLAISPSAWNGAENGHFFQDRVTVSKHLPLAHTHSTPEEEAQFWTAIEDLRVQLS